ncbi:autotransporter domain-containing protein [Reyranella sp.]|uniref:autotransporter outer membrane beta-barrel domain-containing protein n=1 Tax=Reyranella sp. TaxID=1929291 RepID=UPI00120A5603|nr:autotransporter outer membrane beta-barrel domain-containing protein [Reyranella sp.]TAJ90419.1 MAG: autotransporter domain-containing protein [Reyranella sp.]
MPTVAFSQDSRWDALLTNSNWYVPIPGLIAYASSNQSFTTPPPTPIGDQTLWALGTATNGVFTGQSQASFYMNGITTTGISAMQGLVTSGGQIVIAFSSDTAPTTIGIGQMREIGGVPLMEMQMITGTSLLVTHWAYMTPYNPAVFTPPSPSQVVTADITSPQWRWTAGTTWRLASSTLFGTSTPGTFKITNYSNGYYWGLGAAPQGSTVGNFTVMGSMTPEGNVLFSLLSDGVPNNLSGQITGDASSGIMVLHPYAGSGTYGPASEASIMPVSAIAAGQTYFISNIGTSVIPAFTGGTLQVDTIGQAYGQNFTLDGSASNRLDQRGNSALLSGILSDASPGTPGQITIANSESGGRIILTGANTYTGPTMVEAGATLVVNGSIVSPVTVGGVLGGTGTVGATTISNGGVLAPGNSIGTINVTGNLSFAPGATYVVEISPGAADRTNVTGTANLQGTTLAAFTPGNYSPRGYTLLSAAGGRSGTFGNFVTVDLPDGFIASLAYTSTDVQLNLTAALGMGTTLTANQSAVAGAINNGFNSGNSLPSGLSALFSQSGATLASSLNTLSGEAQSGVQVSTFAFGNQFLNTLLASGGSTGPQQQTAQYASLTANEANAEPRRLRGWVAGFGGYGWLGGTANNGSSSVQTSVQGLAAGADWTFDQGVLGVAVASGTSNWYLGGGLGNGRTNAFQAGVYGRTTFGSLYLAAAGAWGLHGVSTQRSVPYLADSLTANYTATSWSGRAEMGYRLAFGDYGVTPFIAGQSQVVNMPGFCEASQAGNGAALCFNANSTPSLRSEIGIDADAAIGNILGSRAKLMARLAWAHEYQTTGSVSAWFQSLPGSTFAVSGASMPSDMGIARVMANFELDRAWSFRLQADAEFADRYGAFAGTARLAGRF